MGGRKLPRAGCPSNPSNAQGSTPPLRDWEPSPQELKDYLSGILDRLVQIASGPGPLSGAAREAIAQHLRGLSKPAPGHKIYPYLLRGVKFERVDQVWAMDITYIPMARGSVYLAAVVDVFSRRVLSHRLSITIEADFCVEALEEALAKHGKPVLLIWVDVHADCNKHVSMRN